MTPARDPEPFEPPLLARMLLETVLPLETEESVSGDLIEEYRHRLLRGSSHRPAVFWYLRQVAGFVWRAIWMFTAFVAAAVALRDIVDTFVPVVPGPHAYQLRSAFTTWSAVAIYLSAGFVAALKSGKISTGLFVALASHVVGHLVAISVGAVLFFSVIARNLAALEEFQLSGGWGEAWSIPLMLVPIVAILAIVGACVGRLVRRPLTGRLT